MQSQSTFNSAHKDDEIACMHCVPWIEKSSVIAAASIPPSHRILHGLWLEQKSVPRHELLACGTADHVACLRIARSCSFASGAHMTRIQGVWRQAQT